MSTKKKIVRGKGTPKSTPRPPSRPKPPPEEHEIIDEGKKNQEDSNNNKNNKKNSNKKSNSKKDSSSSEKKEEIADDIYEGKKSEETTDKPGDGIKKSKKKKSSKASKIDELRKKNKSKPKSPGLFMMEDDEDAEVHDDNIVGGSFLDIGARRNRNNLGVSSNTSSKKEQKKKKDKKKKTSSTTKSSKSSSIRTPESTNKKTFDDDNEGDVLDGGKDFGRPSVVLDSDSISKSRNKFSSNSHNKPKPHELVYRSASSDEDESHNVVPIDMHDLMSSIRKAAPGAANYGSGDDDDENGKIPSKTPRRNKKDYFSSDEEVDIPVAGSEKKKEKKAKRKKKSSSSSSSSSSKKMSIIDHVARAMKHHDSVSEIMKSRALSDEELHMLMFFAESCDHMTRRVAKFVEKESLDGNSGAKDLIKGNAFIKEKIIEDIAGEDEEELENMLNKMKQQEKDELRAKGKPQPAEGDDGSEMPRKLRKYFQSPDFDFIQFLKNPVPDELGMVYFRVIGDHKQNELFVILDYDVEAFGDLVMTAKKKTNLLGSGGKKGYKIKCDNETIGKVEQIQSGKVLQYNIITENKLKRKVKNDPYSGDRIQLGAIQITNTKDCPRHMTVLLPEMIPKNEKVDDGEEIQAPWKPMHPKDEMLSQWKSGKFDHLSFYENKKPHFDEAIGAYTLDFDGRVTMASSKNYLLVSSHSLDDVYVRFGRVENREFTMDVRYPCSPLQALGISIASIITKTTG